MEKLKVGFVKHKQLEKIISSQFEFIVICSGAGTIFGQGCKTESAKIENDPFYPKTSVLQKKNKVFAGLWSVF